MNDKDILLELINQIQDQGVKTTFGRNDITTATVDNERLVEHLLRNNVRVKGDLCNG